MGHFPAWTCGDCLDFKSPQCPSLISIDKYSNPIPSCWKPPEIIYEGWGPETEESRYDSCLIHFHCDSCGDCMLDRKKYPKQADKGHTCKVCIQSQLPPCPVCGSRNFKLWYESDTGYRTTICGSCKADMADYDWTPNK
jgi:hypothetical protein